MLSSDVTTFQSLEKLFLFLEYIFKHILLADFAKNKKMEKLFPIFPQIHGLNLLEKSQFLSTFLTFRFL